MKPTRTIRYPKCYPLTAAAGATAEIVFPATAHYCQLTNRSTTPVYCQLNGDDNAQVYVDANTTQIFSNGDVHVVGVSVPGPCDVYVTAAMMDQ